MKIERPSKSQGSLKHNRSFFCQKSHPGCRFSIRNTRFQPELEQSSQYHMGKSKFESDCGSLRKLKMQVFVQSFQTISTHRFRVLLITVFSAAKSSSKILCKVIFEVCEKWLNNKESVPNNSKNGHFSSEISSCIQAFHRKVLISGSFWVAAQSKTCPTNLEYVICSRRKVKIQVWMQIFKRFANRSVALFTIQ